MLQRCTSCGCDLSSNLVWHDAFCPFNASRGPPPNPQQSLPSLKLEPIQKQLDCLSRLIAEEIRQQKTAQRDTLKEKSLKAQVHERDSIIENLRKEIEGKKLAFQKLEEELRTLKSQLTLPQTGLRHIDID